MLITANTILAPPVTALTPARLRLHRADGGTYWFFALMSSMEAAQHHAGNEGMQAAMPAMMALLDGPPDMAMTASVAANGFEF